MSRKAEPKTTPTFQTVRLKRGRHISAEHGVCVMELASMLAGERFTDHPRSVSPVIATYLRVYNDLVDDQRRQDLYRLAAACVGTRASRRIERLRAQRLSDLLGEAARKPWTSRFSLPERRRDQWAMRAARALASDTDRHGEALARAEELISIGRNTDAVVAPVAAATAVAIERYLEDLAAYHG